MISASQSLYEKAKRLIPGGTQLLSKRPEMFAPENWPAYYREAQGCEVIDLDGNRLLDMSIMGIGIDYQQMIKGLVLLAAVVFDVYNKQKQG